MPLKHQNDGYNPLAMWKEPRETIAAAFESPSMAISLGVFFLPYILSLIIMFIFGVVINPGIVVLNVVREFIVFTVIALILSVVVARTSREKDLFRRCFSVLVLSRMITVLLFLVLTVFLIINPGVTEQVVPWLHGQQTSAEVVSAINTIDSPVLDVSFWLALLVFFFFSIWIVYAQFLAVKEAAKGSLGRQLFILVFLFVIGYFLNLLSQIGMVYLLAAL